MTFFKIAASMIVLGCAQAIAQSPENAAIDALSEAEATPDLRFSYTMTFETPGNETIVTRYDAETRRWTTISGDPSGLPRQAATKLRNVQKSESVPGGLLYADFRKHLDDITFLNTTEGSHVFAFVPPEARGREVGAELDQVMLARLYVDETDGHLTKYEVRALQPFKPMAVVKLEEFAVIQEFERLSVDGPAVLVKLYARTKGRRALKSVDTEFTASFSDFQLIP